MTVNWYGYYAEETPLSAARTIARERAGRRRPDETDEEYAERVESHMPRGERIPMPSTQRGRDAAVAREHRRLR